jgi:hypothetical protein
MTIAGEITPVRTENRVALTHAARTEVREMVDRIKAGMLGSSEWPAQAVIAMAQASIAHGLDPWNGEIYVLHNKNTGETGLMVGIKGLRKAARKQMPPREQFYTHFKAVLPGSEDWKRYGLDEETNKGSVTMAVVCVLRRSDVQAKHVEILERLHALGMTLGDAIEMAGPLPSYEGVGIVRSNERSKMEKGQLARKRAEADAIKQAFDLPFMSSDDSESSDDQAASISVEAAAVAATLPAALPEHIEEGELVAPEVEEDIAPPSLAQVRPSPAAVTVREETKTTATSDAVAREMTGVISTAEAPAAETAVPAGKLLDALRGTEMPERVSTICSAVNEQMKLRELKKQLSVGEIQRALRDVMPGNISMNVPVKLDAQYWPALIDRMETVLESK